MIFDKNLKIKGSNLKFQELFKWDKKEITGKGLNILSTESSVKYLKEIIKKYDDSPAELSIPLLLNHYIFYYLILAAIFYKKE